MTSKVQIFEWHMIGRVPTEPGIYAWYYKPSLPDRDVTDLIEQLKQVSTSQRSDLVRHFLQRHLFDPFAESPYSATISGALKPTYEGELCIRAAVSEDLVERIVASPERLRRIKQALEASVPDFSSPIYIGMAVNLRRRLETHKAAICRLKDTRDAPLEVNESNEDDRRRAHSFAKEVARRQLSVIRLLVVVRQTDQLGDEYKDAENILNRINFPVCGRN